MTRKTAEVAPRTETGRMDANKRKDMALGELTRALEREVATVSELREALVRQRAGVATDAVESVHAACDDVARLLVAIEAARRHRVMRLESLSVSGDARLETLELALGHALPTPLAEARAALRHEAAAAAREAGINRVVLQRTVEAGEAFLQALFSNAGGPDPVYRAGERREDDGAGLMLDRTA